MKSKIVITGGSGFIGSKLVERACELGYEVVNLDLKERTFLGAESRICDIRDSESVLKSFPKDVSVLFHLAGLTSVLQSKLDPQGVFNSNVIGTQNLLEASRISGVETVILASSNAVVGGNDTHEIDEMGSLSPLTPYGATKAAAEMLLSAYSGSYDMRTSAIRLTNVYGLDMFAKDSIMPRIMRALLGGNPIEVYGDGQQWRDFVFASDVVDAFFLALDLKIIGPLTIGFGESYTVLEILESVERVTGLAVPYIMGPAKVGEMRGVRVNIQRARSYGFTPKVSLDSGIEMLWQDFKDQ